VSDSVQIAYDKNDLRRVLGAFKAMDEEATKAAKTESSALAEFAKGKIIAKASTRGIAASRIAQGSRVSKSSKIGELSLALQVKSFQAVERLKCFGAAMNSDQIHSGSSQSGQVELAAVRLAGLFIRHFEQYSQTSSTNGRMLLIES
jgi:hypothetical protein